MPEPAPEVEMTTPAPPPPSHATPHTADGTRHHTAEPFTGMYDHEEEPVDQPGVAFGAAPPPGGAGSGPPARAGALDRVRPVGEDLGPGIDLGPFSSDPEHPAYTIGAAGHLYEHRDDVLSYGVGTGIFGARIREDETEIGAQADVVRGSVDIGTPTNPEAHYDTDVEVGGAVGAGASVRLHYDDRDHDGYREYGLGMSGGLLGEGQIDVRSELPGLIMETIGEGIDWLGRDDEPRFRPVRHAPDAS